jgi:hypothetical protein
MEVARELLAEGKAAAGAEAVEGEVLSEVERGLLIRV